MLASVVKVVLQTASFFFTGYKCKLSTCMNIISFTGLLQHCRLLFFSLVSSTTLV